MIVTELANPKEIIDAAATKIKEAQKLQGYTNSSFAIECGLSKRTYEDFIYKGTISLTNFIIVLKKLDMLNELNSLVKPIEPKTIEEEKKLLHIREIQNRKKDKKKKTSQDYLNSVSRLKARLSHE
jgi:flavin-dependent dehydrogenase